MVLCSGQRIVRRSLSGIVAGMEVEPGTSTRIGEEVTAQAAIRI